MKNILRLNNPERFEFDSLHRGANVTESKKAYIVDFVNPRGGNQPVRTWVPVSHSTIENGMLKVADWLLEPRRNGIGALVKAGYRCLVGEPVLESVTPTETPKQGLALGAIAKGYFTVEGGDKHRTFKIKTNRKGQTLIGLMVGRNNTTDYAWFAFVDGTKLRFWGKAKYNQMTYTLPISRDEIEECFNAIIGNVDEAGKRFATVYKICSRCARPLTTPESLERGLGPECAGLKYGGGK
jgi:hypothetical protein